MQYRTEATVLFQYQSKPPQQTIAVPDGGLLLRRCAGLVYQRTGCLITAHLLSLALLVHALKAQDAPMQMAVDLDLLGQELERWAAMGTAHTSTEQTASCKAPVQAASPTSDDSTDCGPSAEAEAEVPPQKPKKKRVRRQREELLYLRKKAKQLEDELERLAQREATADGQVAATGTASSLWEGIASRQLQVRCQAEDENRRLKRMLENQLTLARRFECFLRGSGEPVRSLGVDFVPHSYILCANAFELPVLIDWSGSVSSNRHALPPPSARGLWEALWH